MRSEYFPLPSEEEKLPKRLIPLWHKLLGRILKLICILLVVSPVLWLASRHLFLSFHKKFANDLSLENRKLTADFLVKDRAFIMAHDSATSYMAESSATSLLPAVVFNYTKTQPSGGFAQLLECGARAFDIRPRISYITGELVMHHGVVTIYKSLGRALKDDILAWSAKNDDLIILFMNHFEKDEARTRTISLLKELNIPIFNDAETVANMGYEEILDLSKVVAVFDDVHENYVPDIVCDTANYSCVSKKTLSMPFETLEDYMEEYSKASAEKNSGLWMLQAHWQYTTDSVILGLERSGSVIYDNIESRVNEFVLKNIQRKKYPYVNLLELDNVCLYGTAIKASLRDPMLLSHRKPFAHP